MVKALKVLLRYIFFRPRPLGYIKPFTLTTSSGEKHTFRHKPKFKRWLKRWILSAVSLAALASSPSTAYSAVPGVFGVPTKVTAVIIGTVTVTALSTNPVATYDAFTSSVVYSSVTVTSAASLQVFAARTTGSRVSVECQPPTGNTSSVYVRWCQAATITDTEIPSGALTWEPPSVMNCSLNVIARAGTQTLRCVEYWR